MGAKFAVGDKVQWEDWSGAYTGEVLALAGEDGDVAVRNSDGNIVLVNKDELEPAKPTPKPTGSETVREYKYSDGRLLWTNAAPSLSHIFGFVPTGREHSFDPA